MNIDEALGEADTETPGSALFVLAAAYKAQETTVRRGERERLAQWFESNAETLRGFQPDGLSIEFVVFLLRLAGEPE